MQHQEKSNVLITDEACNYLGISKPTYFKYLTTGRIKGIKVGRGWRILKSELDRFLDETREIKSSEIRAPETLPQRIIHKSDTKMPRTIFRWRVTKRTRVRNCLKCGRQVILEEGFFLCESCRNSNSLLEDLGGMYQSYLHGNGSNVWIRGMDRDF